MTEVIALVSIMSQGAYIISLFGIFPHISTKENVLDTLD
jgi:hypothetical protein